MERFQESNHIHNHMPSTSQNDNLSHDNSPCLVSVIFDKRGCESMLRKHAALKTRIEETVTTQLANGLFKSKFATSKRWNGSPIWECRVNEKSVGSVRIAFSVSGETVTVIYLSKTLQKQAFTAELERFLG